VEKIKIAIICSNVHVKEILVKKKNPDYDPSASDVQYNAFGYMKYDQGSSWNIFAVWKDFFYRLALDTLRCAVEQSSEVSSCFF